MWFLANYLRYNIADLSIDRLENKHIVMPIQPWCMKKFHFLICRDLNENSIHEIEDGSFDGASQLVDL